MNRIAVRLVSLATALLVTAGPLLGDTVSAERAQDHQWNFDVYLDDSQIGHHNFHLQRKGDAWLLTTEADFRVRFLFFTAYQYQHSNTEVWQNSCLQRIESTTNANGKPFAVNGFKSEVGFTVETKQFTDEIGGCVKTFAYWDAAILEESSLLNSQTGELLPISVTPVAQESLIVRGQPVQATRYQLVAKNMELDIWYSNDRRWLALESTVKGGRKLRYELT